MPTQYSNHRDTPLRRFNTFWWGLAYFGIFGLVSAVVYWQTGKPVDAAAADRAAGRMEVKTEVDEAQGKMMPPAGATDNMGSEIKGAPTASSQFVPGSESHKKAMEKLAGAGGEGGGEGFKLYTSKACNTCHGADANTPISPAYPKLGGQNIDYSLAQIKDIHSGARANGQSAAMKATVAAMKVSEDEMKTISEWMGGLEKPDVTLVDGAGKDLYHNKGCVACHGADANTPLPGQPYPKLAGQNAQYTLEQLKAIKDGTRANGQSAAMKAIMAAVSEEEMKILAEWLAGQK